MDFVDLRIDGEGQVLAIEQSGRVPGAIFTQLDRVDTITRLMGLDASAELLYAYTVDGCAMREVVLSNLTPPAKARCIMLRGANKHEIVCRLAFAEAGLR